MSEFKDIDTSAEQFDQITSEEMSIWLERNFQILRDLLEAGDGVSDTFTTTDGKTVTVVNGIITSIV